MPPETPRRLLTAELLSIGSELTVGETRDTNAGELARSLSGLGVRVTRMTALPDDLTMVSAAFADGLERVDLVVSTGGLGPTPDDLTRESIAAVCGEDPVPDPDLETWLRELWARRGIPFPESNLKQAWLIPSATALANPNGTAPGWFVMRPDGRVVVALPGPPREMRPMWNDEAVPRLQAIGLGAPMAARTFRLAGIGESQVAERLGETLLRSANPVVATYARVEAVDVRISATGDDPVAANALVEQVAATVLEQLGEHVWAMGETTWADAIGARLGELGWTLGVVEIGTGGSVGTVLGDAEWLRFDETIATNAPAATAHLDPTLATDDERADDDDERADGEARAPSPAPGEPDPVPRGLIAYARRARELGGADVGIAVRARPRSADTAVAVSIVTPRGERSVSRLVFLTGAQGRSRAALSAASVLFETLRDG